MVKTDTQGNYTLKPSRDSVFVYITRPAGHDVRGDWYKPLADRVDFELQPAAHNEDDYIFVHVTDTHVSTNPRSHQGLSRFVREVNALSPRPRFVVNSGDLLDLHKALISKPESGQRDFRTYVGITNHLAMPYYNVAGITRILLIASISSLAVIIVAASRCTGNISARISSSSSTARFTLRQSTLATILARGRLTSSLMENASASLRRTSERNTHSRFLLLFCRRSTCCRFASPRQATASVSAAHSSRFGEEYFAILGTMLSEK